MSGHERKLDGALPFPEEFSTHTSHDSAGYRLAYVLYHWPRPAIERHLLRSLLAAGDPIPKGPEGGRATAPNQAATRKRITFKFKSKLRAWEQDGRLRRDETWVHILDRSFFAEAASRLVVDKAMWLAEVVQDYRQAPIDPDLRRRELLTLQALMEGRDVHHSSGRGAIRLLPRGRTI